MIDFFDKLRFWGAKRNKFLSSLYFYQIMNKSSEILANLILPIYFSVTKRKYTLVGKVAKNKKRIIVSLTTFPARLPKVWMVIEAMLRQTCKPDKIVLYLTKSQVPDIEKLPKQLLEQRQRGLEIVLCEEEIRSHTKYFGAFRDYPDDIIITVDDDILYKKDLIETLIKYHKKFPHSIITNWAKKIQHAPGEKSLYSCWPETGADDIGIEHSHYSIFGVGGMLYPPHCMYKDCLNSKMIQELCLTADDIWLSCMAILNKTKFVFTGYKQNHLPVTIHNNTTLLSVNYERNQICVDNLNHYYKNTLKCEPLTYLLENK